MKNKHVNDAWNQMNLFSFVEQRFVYIYVDLWNPAIKVNIQFYFDYLVISVSNLLCLNLRFSALITDLQNPFCNKHKQANHLKLIANKPLSSHAGCAWT